MTGTSGNDTINATIVTGTAASTFLNLSDSIDLDGGTDTITINYANTAATVAATALPTLNGVEILTLKNLGGASTIQGTVVPSVTTLNIDNPLAASALTTGATKLSANVATLGLSNVAFDDNDVSLSFATGAHTGTADAFAINLAAVSSATTATANTYPVIALAGTNGGIETLNVTATSTSRLDDLTVTDGATQSMTTLNVSGAGSFRVNTALNFKGTSGTINASANTGGVTLVVGTENLTITGGTGNDVITFGTAGDLDANDSLNLGDGTDKIVLADTAVSATTTALNAAINASTAEIIGFSAAASVDMSKVTATKVAMSSTTNVALTVTKLESTDTVIIDTGTTTTADLTVAGSLGYNTLNLELAGTSSASVSMDNVDATNQSTVNIVSNGTKSATANTLDNLSLSAQAVVNITGAQDLTITNALDNTAVVINGASFTGKLTVTAGTAASSIVGGSGKDTITGGTGADTLTGGAGDDTINTGANATAIGETVNGGLGADTVTIQNADAAGGAVVNQTLAYNATAAESYSSASATGTAFMDTLTLSDSTDDVITITFTTGVTPTTQTGALTATTTAPTMGTTTVSAGGFYVYNSVAEADGVTAGTWIVYQDTNANGVVDQGEFAIKIVGTTDASDTEAFAVTSGKLVLTLTGA